MSCVGSIPECVCVQNVFMWVKVGHFFFHIFELWLLEMADRHFIHQRVTEVGLSVGTIMEDLV